MNGDGAAFRAPWSAVVRILSIAGTLLLGGISAFQLVALPSPPAVAWALRWALALPAVILVGSALFTVRGYELAPRRLRVRRLLWSTEVPLEGLRRAWASPEAMSGSWRLFGNGGLFSITGLFRNARLGTYRAYAMDRRRAVVLELPRRPVVVTPDSPEAFLRELERCCPGVVLGPEGGDRG
ncbi:MAG: hypothetical protein KDB94_07920 [Acidobacteria bacterium]|nr:hypothetical protein [Acidobacteriota bacterium]MCB9377387.1 hypothetical protein [Holophagales bacterium]